MPPPAIAAQHSAERAAEPAARSAGVPVADATLSGPAGSIGALADASDDALSSFTRFDTRADGTRIAESSLRISGMHCAACAGSIEQALARVPGVLDARVSAAAQCATVRWDSGRARAADLIAAVESAGYGAVPDTTAAARAVRLRESRLALWRVFVAAFCAMQVMMFATPSYVSAPGELPLDQKQLLDWGAWLLTLPVMGFAAAPFFQGAWRALRQRRIGMDVPVALGIAVAFVASSGAAFAPGGAFGSEVWFDSLTMFVSFLLIGRWFELRLRHRAELALEASTSQLPDTVLRLRADGGVDEVRATALQRGDRVRVPVGQAFAADGVVEQGSTQVDEALLTGESRPVAKAEGDEVIAGSLNRGAPVLVRVERAGADTRREAIAALMRAARAQRPALLASADRWAAPFLWAVLLLAGGAGVAWSQIDPSRALWVVVSVLVVTCPCALSLAAPSALLSAAAAMARRGLLPARLDAIERLAQMRTLFVDKTGTLTEGRLVCVGIERLAVAAPAAVLGPDEPAERFTDDQLQRVAASLAGWSSHPLAQALRAEAGSSDARVWHALNEQPGLGLEGIDSDGHRWRLGQASWVGVTEAAGRHTSADDHASAQTCLSRDGRPLARFLFDESLRPDAMSAVRALQADGVRIHLLSGDDPARAQRMADRLGLDAASGGLSPEGKLALVQVAQASGQVVGMLGDGINDAPVLARADVSIAMGEGAWLARTQADAVLLSNQLGDLVRARGLARRALRVVRQNFLWAALYNTACVPLALTGLLPPWAAGLGMAASSLFVVLNSLRLAR